VTFRLRRGTLAAVTAMTVAATVLLAASGSEAKNPDNPEWVGTWASALTAASLGNAQGSLAGFTDQSVRMIVRTSVGGDQLRVRLSNAYGTGPVAVGHATVGRPAAPGSADLVPGSVRELTFQGSETVTLYKGADVLSDPLAMDVPSLTELAVTLYLPTATGPTSFHNTARENTFVYPGDRAEDASGAGATVTRFAFYFLAGIDVGREDADGSVLVLGDSISDGNGSTVNANTRWPDFLATRVMDPTLDDHEEGVLNLGLAGNRLTHDGLEQNLTSFGNSGLARLDTDVFGQTDVRAAIVQLGINDINLAPNDPAGRIIAGLQQVAAQLREQNMPVLVCTLGPFEGFTGAPSWTPEKEAVRLAVNNYIRNQNDFNAVVDLDAVLRDPAQPSRLRAEFDSGDHIHPNDAGAQALAAAVPLNEF
jgi:lysophospholipase L1-like esterase